jgi:hypothetical protein
MLQRPDSSAQLVALLRRPGHGGPLRFVTPPDRGGVRQGLSLRPRDLDLKADAAGALLVQLPRGGVSAAQKGQHRKAALPNLGTVLRGFARALRQCPEIRGDADRLDALARKLARYGNLRHRAGQGVHAALDLRLVLGGLQAHLLGAVLTQVAARLEAGLPRAEVERLQNRFSKLLLRKEALLASRAEGRAALVPEKEALAQAAEETERWQMVEDIMEAIRQGRPLDQATLETAAAAYAELKGKKGTDARRTRR